MSLATNFLKKNAYYISFAIALSGVLGSLYFSEIAGYTPCLLCWWQRILMYPLAVILAVGILRSDKNLAYYVLPFSLLGIPIALYQELLQIGVLEETIQSCVEGVSCAVKYIDWFGFITIPLLSLVAFTTVSALMFLVIKSKNKQ